MVSVSIHIRRIISHDLWSYSNLTLLINVRKVLFLISTTLQTQSCLRKIDNTLKALKLEIKENSRKMHELDRYVHYAILTA